MPWIFKKAEKPCKKGQVKEILVCFKGVNAVFLLWRMHAKGIEVTKKNNKLIMHAESHISVFLCEKMKVRKKHA